MTVSQLAIIDGGPALPPVHDLWEWIQEGFDINRSAIALVVAYEKPDHLSYLLSDRFKQPQRPNQTCLEWNFEQLEMAAMVLATFLHDQGIGRTDVVSTFVTNSLEWTVVLLASIRLGVVFAPMDMREITHREMLQYHMECAGTTVVVVLDEHTASVFDAHVNMDLPVKLKIIFNQMSFHPGWVNLRHISTEITSTKLPKTSDQRASDICSIGFTSGTTSLPKPVAYTIENLTYIHHPTKVFHRNGYDTSARWILNTTNFRVVMRITLLDAWRCGASAVIPSPAFDPECLLRVLTEQQCTHMHTIPAQAKIIARLPDFDEKRPQSIRYIVLGGDVTNSNILETIKADFRAERIETSWGMTEALGICYMDAALPTFSAEGFACVGRPLPGTVAKICLENSEPGLGTPESHKPCKRGEDGILHMSGPGVAHYRFNRSPEAFYDDEDGRRWLITGDVARMDNEGQIYVIGRSKDIIKWKGLALSPATFESILTGLPEIQQITVFGLPSELEGSIPVAVIECRDEDQLPTLETLNQVLGEQRADDYRLAAVYELKDLGFDHWPVNAVGKTMKKDLLDAAIRLRFNG